ncbi:MAG: S9 family peptidase, partial [Caulobacteraceae bacterium]|nr:S9 family peptidase [Caulobacteraceae bacterium]
MQLFVRRRVWLFLAAALLLSNAAVHPALAQAAPDPFQWLEDVNGPRAMAWVQAENAKTRAVLQSDPRFPGLYAEALALAQAKDRIPAPELIGDQVYNFWRDETHVRGVWRRTSQADYAGATPHWTTVLDLDALAAAEHANWVWEGANCPPLPKPRCLISLSDGGEDATTVREFDLEARAFVPGGFVLPHSKQGADWLDADTLLVARDWGPGTMTTSGYPFVVKALKRGQSLGQAKEVYRGAPSDVEVEPNVLRDGDGNVLPLIERGIDFFRSQTYQLTDDHTVRLDLPEKVAVNGLLHGRLIFTAEQDWTFAKAAYPAGSLFGVEPARLNEPHPVATAGDRPVFEPGPRQSIDQVTVTRDEVIAAIYDNVRGKIISFAPSAKGAWTPRPLPAPTNASVDVAASFPTSDALYYDVQSFLDPTRLYEANAATGIAEPVKALPPRFDASRDVVDQFEATSADGTKVPYFVVHPKTMKLDGANPTILYAYGGFQVSETPVYSAALGKLWLERGGVYVLANIRGGGEFGPAWHEAAVKTKRQAAFDDFAAVARDLIAHGITSPRRLGIEGGSNGGLLMGVEFTQHPELWRAVDIQVPLLDMLRFEQIAAGASWVGEYGSVSNPEERAFLARISPYANLKPGVAYPEPFIWTTTKDDRVGPQHARKFAAKL